MPTDTATNKDLKDVLLDALLIALPFVEDALDSEDFKPGYVKKQAAIIRAAISQAEVRS